MALDRSSKAGIGVCLLAVCVIAAVAALALHQSGPVDTKNKSNPTGWVAVVGAIVVFGSFGILMKAERVIRVDPDPVVFQTYIAYGVAFSSILVLVYVDWVWSWWGVLGAGMWWCNSLCSFVAVSKVGYALGPSIWAGMTIVVSFLWGSLLFHESVTSLPLAIGGMVILVAGICIATYSETLSTASSSSSAASAAASGSAPFADANRSDEMYHMMSPSDSPRAVGGDTGGASGKSSTAANRTIGFIAVACVGCINGSLMVPFTKFSQTVSVSGASSSSSNKSIAYLSSFSVGIACLSPVFLGLYYLAVCRTRRPRFYCNDVSLPGLVTGFLWATGNFASCYATQYLGSTIGYPLTQCCIVVNGLWGLLFFKELRGCKAIGVFCVGLCVILCGSMLLAIYG